MSKASSAPSWSRRTAAAASVALTLTLTLAPAGCAGGGTFRISAEDNSPAALARAFTAEQKPAVGKPINETGKELLFLVLAGKPRKLMAWDLAAGKAAWTVDSEVTSRVAVGSQLIAHRVGKDKIVARSAVDGHELWSVGLGANYTFLGLAVDGARVFYVVQDDSGKRVWRLIAVENGREVWRAGAPGTLGAPAARGGLVFMPFMTQWLAILDAATGEQIARIRQDDEAINFVRTTTDGVYYGSRGVFRLDEKSAAGTRGGASYVIAKLPEFVRIFYYLDAFQPVQAQYSAFDRNRILWRASGSGPFAFQNNLVTVFTYRFFFAFDAVTGALKWAHHHPRFDVVAAENLGGTIVYVSQEGELITLDAATGSAFAPAKLDGRVLGATFDADGYRPAGEGAPVNTVGALASIIFDKDARFTPQKAFAVEVLASLPGADVAKSLLGILRADGVPAPIYAKGSEVLIARKDPEALPVLIEALQTRSDYLAGTKPRAVDVIARALGVIGKPEAAPALLAHLDDPTTPLATVKDIAAALGLCGSPEALPALRSYLLLYRADPLFASDTGPLAAVIESLLAIGGGAERELVSFVAQDPRTQPKVAEYARRALDQTRAPATEGGQGK